MATPLDPELVAQIRESLHAGRGVRLFGDEPPVAKLDVLTPMDAAGEAFLEGKLAKVAELLERGFVVNIDNDGAILASTPDNRSRYISTMETEIDAMDRLMVKTALEQGATVAIEADGSLVINAAATPTTVPAATVAAQFAEFERLADSGEIGTELAAGRDFQFAPAAVAVPAPTTPLEDPFDTAAELEATADRLQAGVDAARESSLPEYVDDKQEADAERNAAERQLAMTTAERDVAQRQAMTAQTEALSTSQKAVDLRTEADKRRGAGNEAGADSADADAASYEAQARISTQTAQGAQRDLDAANIRLDDERAEFDRLKAASEEVNAEMGRLEDVLDDQEIQVFHARGAAKSLAEIARLEAELPALEASGGAELDRVRAAIADHRAAADKHIEKGKLRDLKEPVVVAPVATEADIIDPNVDPEVPAPILTDPDGTAPGDTDPDDTDPDDTDPDDTDPDEDSPVPSEPTKHDPSSPPSSSHEPDIIDFGESSPASSEPTDPYPDPIYPTMADPAQNDPDIIDMDDDRPWTPLEGATDGAVELDIPEADSSVDAPQFEERLDDINDISRDLDELAD